MQYGNAISNDIPYEDFALKQTHPRHLFAIAKLYGLNPPAIEKCKVLELGCASGNNLIPMAFYYPDAFFVGMDIMQAQIHLGRKRITELQLKNIELRDESITDFTSEALFDYIICHGVYSWVDNQVKDKIFDICNKYLSLNGVAYVSYNTYPGWLFPDIVRNMMLFATKEITHPLMKAQKARDFLQWMLTGLNQHTSAYANLLKNEIAFVYDHSDNYLIHEHLNSTNQPCYFHEFVSHAKAHQLKYLGEAFLAPCYSEPLFDGVMNEQISDFISNQRFRCSLVCHQNIPITYPINQEALTAFFQKNEKTIQEEAIPLRPQVSLLVQNQLEYGNIVTNIHHENIQLDAFAEILIPYLDGSHDLEDLINIIFEHVNTGELVVLNEKESLIEDKQEIYQRIKMICQKTLTLLNQKTLLSK